MFPNKFNTAAFSCAIWLVIACPCEAQAPLGVRAQGMAGAFVGVADDATAVYWNPAGLATGTFVSFVLDYGESETIPSDRVSQAGGERLTGGMVAFSAPPLGLAYYRTGEYAAGPREAAAPGALGREEVRRSVHALTTSNLAVTLLQSLGHYVVVGGTIKLVRGEAAQGFTGSIGAEQAVDDAAGLPRTGSTTWDVDLAAMVAVEHFRVGGVVRHLATPAFTVGSVETKVVELERQARVGGAWGSGWPGMSRVVLAVDSDVLSRTTMRGERRDVAVGIETWWLGQRLGVRGGMRGSTVGEARSVYAGGASVALKHGIYVDAHLDRGDDDERSWSIGARFTF